MASVKKIKLRKSGVGKKKIEELLRQAQSIVENSYDAIIGETLDGTIISWNGGATRMFGYSADEMIGKSLLSIVPPELKNIILSVLKKIKSGEDVADYDSVRLHKDGRSINIAFSSSPIKTEDGTIIGVSCVERDITRRKEYEEKIKRAAKLYEALSKCNKAVVLCANDGELFDQICKVAVQFGGMTMAWIGLTDEVNKQVKPVSSFGIGTEYLNGLHISVNADDPSGCGPTGISIRENRPIWCQDFEHDPMTANWHKRAANFGWRSSASLPLLKNGLPIGSLTLYSNTINAFDDEAQKLLIEMASDISFALDNFTKKQRLKELNEVRNKFISIISHQLRTPLTAVNWNLEILLNGTFGKLEETQLKFLQVTHSASMEITNRIHILLTAIDIEEGREQYDETEVTLESICAGVVNEMKNKCEMKNITCTYAPPAEDLPIIYGDDQKIRTAASVLVENAIGYTKNGGRIAIALKSKNGVARFEVADTGIGIPDAEKHRVFTRFFRASNASVMQPDAFGLGLFIVKNFIEQHHGKVSFESKEGKGSTFWFELPLKKAM